MKFRSASFRVGLRFISHLFAIAVFAAVLFNSAPALSAEVTSSCPLQQEIAVTFANSQCQEVILTLPQTFYRYYSGSQNKYGRYLTTGKYQTNVEVIRNLALNQSWGNKATFILKVTLPAGTKTYQGIVAPQTPELCYPGGGQQTFIENTRDPNILWSEESDANFVIQDFTCL